MAKVKHLTEKQQKFVDEYITSFRITESYINAGYSVENCTRASINKMAYALFHTEPIQNAIHERLEEMKESRDIVTQKLISRVMAIIDGEEKTADKLRAIELMMKMFSIGGENYNVNTNADLQINFNIEPVE